MSCLSRSRAGVVLLLCVGTLGFVSRFSAAAASFRGIGDLDGSIFSSEARAVTPDGRFVVGFSQSSNGTEAFRWSAEGGMVGLGDLPGGLFQSRAYAVSADGSIVVGTGDDNFKNRAFRWTPPAVIEGLNDFNLAHKGSAATSISADGSIIGGSATLATSTISRACVWTGGSPTPLDVILPDKHSGIYAITAEGSVAVGFGYTESGIEAFRWTVASQQVTPLGDLTGGKNESTAYAISADGSVIVGYGFISTLSSGKVPFRWTEQTGMQPLTDSPLAAGGAARGISGDGSIVVGNSTALGAFIWDEAHDIRSLQSVLTDEYGMDLAGWKLDAAYAITPDGTTIVGSGKNPDGKPEAWIAVIPEPSAGLLLPLVASFALNRCRPRGRRR